LRLANGSSRHASPIAPEIAVGLAPQ
jgi:hypothetical protein